MHRGESKHFITIPLVFIFEFMKTVKNCEKAKKRNFLAVSKNMRTTGVTVIDKMDRWKEIAGHSTR